VYAPWAALLVLAAMLTLQDIRSLDYWWHLRAGRLIAETGAVPRHDPFTYTVPGARWIDIHWLFQLGLHRVFALGGHAAVVLSQLALVGLWLAALAPIGYRRERAWISAGALALMLLVVANRLQARPELPTFVLLAWILRLLDRFQRTPDWRVYAIVPLQLLWVNVHGLFAVGIAVCAIYLVTELLRVLGRTGEGASLDRVRRLAGVTLLAALASLANPNGLEGALYPLQQLDMVGAAERRGTFGMLIDELRPTFDVLDPLSLGLFVGLAGLSLGAIAANWKRVREADLLLWVAFFYLAAGAARNTALFAVVAAPILVRNANGALGSRLLRAGQGAVGAALVAGLALLVAADAARGRWFSRTGPATELGLGVAEGLNPIGAAEWIARARPPAPIAHDLGDGGYLIWRLWPEYAVMSDGRLEVFGPDLLPDLQPFGTARFAALDAKYHFGTVLLNHRRRGREVGRLARALRASGAWRLSYADDVSVVFVRNDADPQRWPALDLGAPGSFDPLDGVNEVAAQRRLSARTRLLVYLGRPDLALRCFEDALIRYPDLPDGAAVLAGLRSLAAGEPLPQQLPAAGALAIPPR
jgi:hypothetical protein